MFSGTSSSTVEDGFRPAFGGQSGTTRRPMTTQVLPSSGSHSAARPAANNDHITPLSQLTKFTARWTILARCTCKRTMKKFHSQYALQGRREQPRVNAETTGWGVQSALYPWLPRTDVTSLSPYTRSPSLSPYTRSPSLSPYTRSPSLSPYTRSPSLSPYTRSPSLSPYTRSPCLSPVWG